MPTKKHKTAAPTAAPPARAPAKPTKQKPAKAPGHSEPAAPPAHARLVLHVLEDRTAVFAVRPNGDVKGHVHPRGRKDLTADIAQLRHAMGVASAMRGVTVREGGVLREVGDAPPAGDATPHL